MNKQAMIDEAMRLADMLVQAEHLSATQSITCQKRLRYFLNTCLSAAIERVPDEYYCLESMSADELRAYDYAFNCFTKGVERILDGKDTGEGIATKPWQGLRERLIKLVKKESNE